MLPTTINRRYKFGFFLTLVAVGLCLLLDASLKQTAGALILGVAATLLLGGLKVRTLQVIGCLIVSASGLVIVGARLMSWRDTNEQAGHEYDNAILDLKDAIARPEWSNVRPITPQPKQSQTEHGPWEKYAAPQPDPLVSAFAALIRAKYPGAYDEMSDDELARKTLAKYPQFAVLLPKGYGQEIQVKTSDGVTHSFPAGTASGVIDAAIKKYIASFPPGVRVVSPPSNGQKESGPWEKYASLKRTKIVGLPESTMKWERRFPFPENGEATAPEGSEGKIQSDGAGQFVLVSKIPFPSEESDSEILRYFQTDVLRPRPVFSLKAALRAELRYVLLGLALFVVGVFGIIWLAWLMPRPKDTESADAKQS